MKILLLSILNVDGHYFLNISQLLKLLILTNYTILLFNGFNLKIVYLY